MMEAAGVALGGVGWLGSDGVLSLCGKQLAVIRENNSACFIPEGFFFVLFCFF